MFKFSACCLLPLLLIALFFAGLRFLKWRNRRRENAASLAVFPTSFVRLRDERGRIYVGVTRYDARREAVMVSIVPSRESYHQSIGEKDELCLKNHAN